MDCYRAEDETRRQDLEEKKEPLNISYVNDFIYNEQYTAHKKYSSIHHSLWTDATL